jgi:hypothetical protein
VIKPLSIGRGDGPKILEELLEKGNLILHKIRSWNVCNNTWYALWNISKETESEFEWVDRFSNASFRNCWVLLLTHKDQITNPVDFLNDYSGPVDKILQWKKHHLRYKYSAFAVQGLLTSKYDDVVYISPRGKQNLVANLLFSKFNEKDFLK